jgi:hypothetical protein
MSKMRGNASAGMPISLSRTDIVTAPGAPVALDQMWPPRSVYSVLLVKRLSKT